MHWYLFVGITLSLSFKASTCLVHFSGRKRSGSLSVFCFLHAYWNMKLPVLALVNHFPESVQYHFLGSLSCFYVVGKTAFSHIRCALPNVSEETMLLFILRDYSYTSRARGASGCWLWAGIYPSYLLFPYRVRPGQARTFPLHDWFYTEMWLLHPKGNQISHRLLD